MKDKLNINNISNIHFIGIGGMGMSGLARFFVQEKKVVTGSDVTKNIITEGLEDLGIRISYQQIESNITDDIDLFIHTEALSDDNPELSRAKSTGKPVINYFEGLGLAANPYYLIAVAGTHGKTTTSAMITDVFASAEKDPTAIIGSLRSKTKSNFRAGKSKYAIVEACEFRRDFLHLTPDVLVITNLEHDHVDYYETLSDVQQAFKELIRNVHDTGVVVTNPTDPNISPVLEECHVPVIDYTKYFDATLKLYAPGIHNQQNASVALAVANHEKINSVTAKTALEEFTGTWRRFEYKGMLSGAHIYDDYAHHPTAVKATLAGLREKYPKHKILAVFQPHTYSRTKGMFNEFAKSFKHADEVIVSPIYSAREENLSGVNSRELAVKILEYGPKAEYKASFADIERYVRSKAEEGVVVIFMGAGSINELSSLLTN